ncbi:MAG: DUF6783 domain-containing protein [Lacrimispora saccharolytica]
MIPANCDAHLAESNFQTRSKRMKEKFSENSCLLGADLLLYK